MQNPSAEAILGRLMRVTGVSTDTALCQALGINRSTLGAWRKRGAVPYAACVNAAGIVGVRVDWLLYGAGAMRDMRDGGDDETPSRAEVSD